MSDIDWCSIHDSMMKYDRSLEDTRLCFTNRPLRPFVDSLWFEESKIIGLRLFLPTITEHLNKSISLLEEIRSLMQIIIEAASGKIEGAHFTIAEPLHLERFRKEAEAMLKDRLTNIGMDEQWFTWFPVVPQHLVERWTDECMNKIPYFDEIALNKDGHLSITSLRHHVKVLDTAIEKTRSLPLYTEEHLMLQFLLHAKRIGVPLNNQIYRDLYDFMEYLDLIPAHILDSHKLNTQRYVRENYIKSLFRHNPWMNDYSPIPNRTAEDIERESETNKLKES